MRLCDSALAAVLLLLSVTFITGLPPPSPAQPELWVWSMYNIQLGPTTVNNLIDQAAAAGYNGIVLSDYKFSIMSSPLLPSFYFPYLDAVIAHAQSKNFKVIVTIYPFGYSDGLYETTQNWNLAEPLKVVGATFQRSGSSLVLQPVFTGPPDSSFESHSGATFSAPWTWQDPTVVVADCTVAHSGSCSMRIDASSVNSRLVNSNFAATPWRQYRASIWIQTSSSFSNGGSLNVRIFEMSSGSIVRQLNQNDLNPPAGQSWTQYSWTFNSMGTTTFGIYIGCWGGLPAGTIWLDDFVIVETAFVNLIRRGGAPFRIYNPSNGQDYTEGVDYNAVADPAIASGAIDQWHTPPTVTIPAGSSIAPGATVACDFYAVQPVTLPDGSQQFGACLTEQAITDYMTQNIQAVQSHLPAQTGYFLSYDEMRQMGGCALCAGKAPTAGGLLAGHVANAIDIVHSCSVNTTNSQIYLWNDMFDPNHNAKNNYYEVPTDISGSWNGIPCGTIIMNWNLGNLNASLRFFANMNLGQIVAGYYDAASGTAQAQKELASAPGVPGVRGFMYTTWGANYGELANYAAAILAGWPSFISSQGTPNPCASVPPSTTPAATVPSGSPAPTTPAPTSPSGSPIPTTPTPTSPSGSPIPTTPVPTSPSGSPIPTTASPTTGSAAPTTVTGTVGTGNSTGSNSVGSGGGLSSGAIAGIVIGVIVALLLLALLGFVLWKYVFSDSDFGSPRRSGSGTVYVINA